jgi:hypothetical protein
MPKSAALGFQFVFAAFAHAHISIVFVGFVRLAQLTRRKIVAVQARAPRSVCLLDPPPLATRIEAFRMKAAFRELGASLDVHEKTAAR